MNLTRETSFGSMYASSVSSIRFLMQKTAPVVIPGGDTPYFYVATADGREGFTVMYISGGRVNINLRGVTSTRISENHREYST